MPRNNYDEYYINALITKDVDEKMSTHIFRPMSQHPNDIAMTLMGHEIRNREAIKKIVKYCKALRSYGLQVGDKITIVMPNIPETVLYFYASNLIGLTPHLVDPRFTFNSIANSIKEDDSKLLICDMSTYHQKIVMNSDRLPVQNVVVVSPVNCMEESIIKSPRDIIIPHKYHQSLQAQYREFMDISDPRRIDHGEFIKSAKRFKGNYEASYDPDRTAIIVNTSGTSSDGVVKGAMHTDRSYNIYTNQIPFITDQLVRGYTYYGYIPYFSMYGSQVGMHTALTHGIIINNIPVFKGTQSLQEMIDSKANIAIGVPNQMKTLAEMYEEQDKDASHVKVYVVGGDNIDPDALNRMNEILLARGMAEKVIFGYGSTETGPSHTTSKNPKSQVPESVGLPYPGVNTKIVDPETLEELPDGIEGEVCQDTPTMMQGYSGNPEATEEVFFCQDGKRYFRTGDLGYKTPDGILHVTGRLKRLVKRVGDGHQSCPIPVENAILRTGLVNKCCVVGIQSQEKRDSGIVGAILTAFISLKDEFKSTENGNFAEVVSDIHEKSLEYISGERETALAYVIVNDEDIKETPNGKVDYKSLEKYTFDSLVKAGYPIYGIPSHEDPEIDFVRGYLEGLPINIIGPKNMVRKRV